MEITKYAAYFKDSIQIGPEDWEMRNRFVDIDESTTIGEVIEWYRSAYKGGAFLINIIEKENL